MDMDNGRVSNAGNMSSITTQSATFLRNTQKKSSPIIRQTITSRLRAQRQEKIQSEIQKLRQQLNGNTKQCVNSTNKLKIPTNATSNNKSSASPFKQNVFPNQNERQNEKFPRKEALKRWTVKTSPTVKKDIKSLSNIFGSCTKTGNNSRRNTISAMHLKRMTNCDKNSAIYKSAAWSCRFSPIPPSPSVARISFRTPSMTKRKSVFTTPLSAGNVLVSSSYIITEPKTPTVDLFHHLRSSDFRNVEEEVDEVFTRNINCNFNSSKVEQQTINNNNLSRNTVINDVNKLEKNSQEKCEKPPTKQLFERVPAESTFTKPTLGTSGIITNGAQMQKPPRISLTTMHFKRVSKCNRNRAIHNIGAWSNKLSPIRSSPSVARVVSRTSPTVERNNIVSAKPLSEGNVSTSSSFVITKPETPDSNSFHHLQSFGFPNVEEENNKLITSNKKCHFDNLEVEQQLANNDNHPRNVVTNDFDKMKRYPLKQWEEASKSQLIRRLPAEYRPITKTASKISGIIRNGAKLEKHPRESLTAMHFKRVSNRDRNRAIHRSYSFNSSTSEIYGHNQ